jgi:hypothetical protein
MQCRACGAKYGLYAHDYNRKGLIETYRGWVPRVTLNELAAARLARDKAEKCLGTDAEAAYGKRWLAHFDGKSKKAVWAELTENGKHYPSLQTFYVHVCNSGLDRVLLRYLDRRELPTVVRVLGPDAADLTARLAQFEQMERDLDELDRRAQQQTVN